MAFKFFHAADIHLDSPLRGLSRYDGAPVEELRRATRGAFLNLVSECIAEEVAFLILAGDLYDGDWKDYNTGLFFLQQMNRLRDAGIDVFIARGNHDAESAMTKSLSLPDNVHVFRDKTPETLTVERCRAALHGQSYPRPDVTANLSLQFPQPIAGAFNIGVLHTNADRSGTEHKPYAPCSVRDLADRGYDYWALGHVHRRTVLATAPLVVFPGNLQGRQVREPGAKGATLVAVDDHRVHHEHRDLDVARWFEREVSIEGAASAHEVVDRAHATLTQLRLEQPERLLAVRVVLRGAGVAHRELLGDVARFVGEIRALANALDAVWVEKVEIQTRTPTDLAAARAEPTPIGELLRTLDGYRTDPALLSEIAKEVKPIEDYLARHHRDARIGLEQPDALRRLLDDAEQLLVQALFESEEPT